MSVQITSKNIKDIELLKKRMDGVKQVVQWSGNKVTLNVTSTTKYIEYKINLTDNRIEGDHIILNGNTTVEGDFEVTGTMIAGGAIQSDNWGLTEGGQLHLEDGTLKFGGSNDPALSINTAGVLECTGAIISGDITATSGTIGGFTAHPTEGLYAGTGATRVQMKAGAGFWAGATAFASAPWSVTPAGVFKAESGTIAGTLTIGGRLATVIGAAIDGSGDFVNDVINANLDTSGKEILGDFTFGVSGAIKMITDADNGLWISPTGILARNAGDTTLTITTLGAITLSGAITALTGDLGTMSISGTLTMGNGSIIDLSSYGKLDLANDGELTASHLKLGNASSGDYTELNTSGELIFKYDGSTALKIDGFVASPGAHVEITDSTGSLMIIGAHIFLGSSGGGGTVQLHATEFIEDGVGNLEIQLVDTKTLTLDTDLLAVEGAITATSYGGITEANLLDLSEAETVSGAWVFSAQIDFTSTDTAVFGGCVQMDRLYLAVRATPPAYEGMVYYDSTANKLKVYTGAAWETIASS